MANETLVHDKPQSTVLLETPPAVPERIGHAAGVQSLMDALSRESEDSAERHPSAQKFLSGLMWVIYAGLAIGVLMLIWSTGNELSRHLPK